MKEGLLGQGKPEAAWESCVRVGGGGESERVVVGEEESQSLREVIVRQQEVCKIAEVCGNPERTLSSPHF